MPLAGNMRWIGISGPERFEIALLAGLAQGDLLGGLAVGVDQPGDVLDLPRRTAAVERRETELLDEHDAVAVRVVEQHRHRRAAADDVEHPFAAPAAGEQAMAEAHDIDPDVPGKAGLGIDDVEIGVGRRRRRAGARWRTWRLRVDCGKPAVRLLRAGQVTIGRSSRVSTAALSISTTHRSGSRPRWRAI